MNYPDEVYKALWGNKTDDLEYYEKTLPVNRDVAIDVGTGPTRRTYKWLKKHFKKVITVDPNYPSKYNELKDVPGEGVADYILFSFNVLNYIPPYQFDSILDHTCRLIKEGGVVTGELANTEVYQTTAWVYRDKLTPLHVKYTKMFVPMLKTYLFSVVEYQGKQYETTRYYYEPYKLTRLTKDGSPLKNLSVSGDYFHVY